MKRIAHYFAAMTILFILMLTAPAAAESPKGPRDIILSWTGSTSTTAAVTWHSDASINTGVLLYGTSRSLAGAMEIPGKISAPTSEITLDYTVWRATMTGLVPGTTYYYAVQNGSVRSGISTFTTGEDSASAFSFLYMGDIHMGVGTDNWGTMLENAYQRNPGMAFGVFGGDIVDSGINATEWQDLLDRVYPVFSEIPLMPASGNHESNFPGGKPKLYLDLLTLPRNGPEGFKEEFYSYDYGGCHITVLNSWVFSGEQRLTGGDYKNISNWIIEDLNSSRAPWKIIVMHHPVYPLASDKVADAVRKNWAPLFEKGGVSLILCGHQHVYSRSYPMTNGQIDDMDGIITVMGNASGKDYSSADEAYQAKTVYGVSNYQIVRIDGNTLTVQSFDADGNELDSVSLRPRVPNGEQKVFSDISDDAWYAPAANYAAERGLMTGTSDNAFSPTASVTRAIAAALLYRLAGAPLIESASVYSDVPSDAWFAHAAAWLSENGIMCGTGSSQFDPNAIITREQLAAIFFRYAQYEKSTFSVLTDLDAFSDTASVSSWASDSVRWSVASGLITGNEGRLDPQGAATRAQCAQILMNFCLTLAF